MPYIQEALQIFKKIGYRYGESFILNYLGSAQMSKGQLTYAIDSLKRGLDISRSSFEPRGEGYCAFNLARAHKSIGNQEEAARYTNFAIDAFGRAKTLHQKAACAFLTALGAWSSADAVVEAEALLECGKALRRAGDFFHECVEIINEAHRIAKENEIIGVLRESDTLLAELKNQLAVTDEQFSA